MKKIVMALALLVGATFVTPCYGKNDQKVVEGDPKVMDTLSYCVGVAHAATMKADASLAAFDFNIAEFNKGLEDYLTGKAKQSYEEVANQLQTLFLQTVVERRAEFDKAQAEGAKVLTEAEGEQKASKEEKKNADKAVKELEFKVFQSERERDEVSYIFGIFLGEEIRKPLSDSEATLHIYWLCKGWEDTYADALAFPMTQMMEYLKGYKAAIEVPTAK